MTGVEFGIWETVDITVVGCGVCCITVLVDAVVDGNGGAGGGPDGGNIDEDVVLVDVEAKFLFEFTGVPPAGMLIVGLVVVVVPLVFITSQFLSPGFLDHSTTFCTVIFGVLYSTGVLVDLSYLFLNRTTETTLCLWLLAEMYK